MWRPSFTILRKVVLPSMKENVTLSRLLYSTKSRLPRSTVKFTLVSAGVGVLIGAGYGGYTHYKINNSRRVVPMEIADFAILKELPEYVPHFKVINDSDNSNLQLILFQYRTCPFCCKVRAYLDSRGISYEIVEVDAVLRQAIKWSGYKKVPIVLARIDGGYQQLLDSTAIMSILETFVRDKSIQLKDIVKFYPTTNHTQDSGKKVTEIANKYFIMHNSPMPDEKERIADEEERKWRQWADRVLVHVLSPNVYRTPSESIETFKWFEDAGGWKNAFPAWECALMVYVGATAMWLIAKRLKSRHNIDDARLSLYDAANKWVNALKKKGTRFMGGESPNLADISVYGVLSSIEGCTAFQDLRFNTDIGKWYDDIKQSIEQKQGKVISVVA